jgi:hypothetical protein
MTHNVILANHYVLRTPEKERKAELELKGV